MTVNTLNKFSAILAATPQGGIGFQGQLPWKLSKDLQFFKVITTYYQRDVQSPENVVIMGRKTWESIPKSLKPLKNRQNIVLSRDKTFYEEFRNRSDVQVFQEIQQCMEHLNSIEFTHCFFIGGAQLYDTCMEFCDSIFFTKIDASESIALDTFVSMEWQEKFERREFPSRVWDALKFYSPKNVPKGGQGGQDKEIQGDKEMQEALEMQRMWQGQHQENATSYQFEFFIRIF